MRSSTSVGDIWPWALAAPPVAMDLASGEVASSHQVATRGMVALERTTTIAAR